MATSVVLRACGGVGPYSWEKTGSVDLSATEGTQITVIASGDGGSSPPGINPAFAAYQFPTVSVFYCDSGFSCVSPSGRDNDLKVRALLGSPTYNCYGTFLGNFTSSGLPNGNPSITAAYSIGCDSSTGATTGPTMTYDAKGPVDDTNIMVSITHNPTTTGGISFSGSHQFSKGSCAFQDFTFSDKLDMRSQASINAGCVFGDCDPSGATVTVTDAVGISVTYTF